MEPSELGSLGTSAGYTPSRITVGGEPLYSKSPTTSQATVYDITSATSIPSVVTIGSITLTAGGPFGTVDGSSHIALGTDGVLEITILVGGGVVTETATTAVCVHSRLLEDKVRSAAHPEGLSTKIWTSYISGHLLASLQSHS